MGYLIFQTLILLLIAFAIGCIIGCWFKRSFAPSETDSSAQSQSAAPPPASTPAAATTSADGRPAMLSGPRGGAKDNLKRVKGIGPVNEGRLNKLGVYHFEQIAGWGANEIKWVDEFLSFKGRIERENWIEQAKSLAGASKN